MILTAPVKRAYIQQKLPCVDRAIMHAARKFMPARIKAGLLANEHGFFIPPGDNSPIHVATPYNILQPHLDRLPIPKGTHALDLGSGLGSACFTMAADERISTVTGYEFAPDVFYEAERIASSFEMDIVRFVNSSFFDAPITDYQFVYFYKPFGNGFSEKMGALLRKTGPGTIVLSRDFSDKNIFPRSLFKSIYTANAPYHGHFFGFIRK